jgi:hypothetical protein
MKQEERVGTDEVAEPQEKTRQVVLVGSKS